MTRTRVAMVAATAALAIALWLGGAPALSWASLGHRLAGWRSDVAARPALAALIYVGVYAGVVALSLPAGGVLSVLGGALFGTWAGGLLAVLAASLGAVLLFLLARHTVGAWMARRAAPLIERVRPALTRDGFSALLAMRLLPVVPFWLGNLAPALLGMRLAPYAAATLLGIMPASFVLAGVGAGARAVLVRGEAPHLAVLVSPPVLLPLLGLAALSLAPTAWRCWRVRRA